MRILSTSDVTRSIAGCKLYDMTKHRKGTPEYGSQEWWQQRLELRRKLIRNVNGLRDLYWRIGYSPSLEEEVRRLISQVCELMDVQVTDLEEFKRRIVAAQHGNSVATNTELPSPCPKLLEDHAFLTLDDRLLEHFDKVS